MSALETLFRGEHAKLVAALTARLHDVAAAEDALQEAFAAAAQQWKGSPPPHASVWLFRVALNKAVDRLRHQARFEHVDDSTLENLEAEPLPERDDDIPDERLRLVFTCCHPSLAPEAQVALTLRTVAGLPTEDVARLFFTEPAAMAQRLVRAQRKIREARIPWVVPGPDVWNERLSTVLAVVYLVFTQGYGSVHGELCDEAIRLGRVLGALLPKAPEVTALLALMLLHDARRAARRNADGLVLLEEQDRSTWDASKVNEGLALVEDALLAGAGGAYAVQAAIAAVHARAARAQDTDWNDIAALYDALYSLQPTPVVALNQAVAHAMAFGFERGLSELDGMRRLLEDQHLFHAARADLLTRLGRASEAATAYRAALARVVHADERQLLERRLAALIRS